MKRRKGYEKEERLWKGGEVMKRRKGYEKKEMYEPSDKQQTISSMFRKRDDISTIQSYNRQEVKEDMTVKRSTIKRSYITTVKRSQKAWPSRGRPSRGHTCNDRQEVIGTGTFLSNFKHFNLNLNNFR